MTSSVDIEDFIVLCERSNFQSRDVILEGVRSKKYELTRSSLDVVPARRMLDIYSRRSRHVRQFAPNSEHATRMVGDIDAYVSALENATDDLIKLWTVSVDDTWSYSIFEGTLAKRIFGCIFTADRRNFSIEEWDELWGRESE